MLRGWAARTREHNMQTILEAAAVSFLIGAGMYMTGLASLIAG
jgi:hypothetical protein